uniref:Chemerin chemokine-like receptor 1 n=1 Tax=Astyanax mexicanus TaxID=7994 RepID=A0A3B1IJM3_ASTMX
MAQQASSFPHILGLTFICAFLTFETLSCTDPACISLTTVLVIFFILGSAGNAVVIWIAGFKLKKSVNTTWYLSLAVSNFLFCLSLPYNVVQKVKDDWIFVIFMCKFMSFIMFLNMFSNIFILVIISVDRCVVDLFPVWAQNHRTIRKASVIVTLVWIISEVFSTLSLVFQGVQPDFNKPMQVCHNKYVYNQNHITVGACRFVFGFVIPFLIIIACYVVIIRKLKINQSAKSISRFKIMTALIKYDKSILHVGVTLASANSSLNPFLYAFMGKDFKRKCFVLLSKMENAVEEEGRSTMRGRSITSSGDRRCSTTV